MGLRGDLAELPLADLIEMTSVGGQDGPSRPLRRGGRGGRRAHLSRGRLVGARCGELSAEKAFYALLTVRAGSFDFDPAAELDEDSFDLSTETLLIEGMRRLDEIHQLRRRLPAPAKVRYLGGEAVDALEARVLGYLGPGARGVGDIVEGVLVGGDADEYDALQALSRMAARGLIGVEHPSGGVTGPPAAGPPQPELER